MHTATKRTGSQRNPSELSEILAFLTSHEVPVVYSAHLLCNVAGINLKQVAECAGIGRNHLYMMLSEVRPVSASARQAFMDCLGIDPWVTVAEASLRSTVGSPTHPRP
jgi:DNA-binding phage protein